jgi:hypothetical protein
MRRRLPPIVYLYFLLSAATIHTNLPPSGLIKRAG